MPEPIQPRRCGKCGAALSGYASEGLCAACLLDSAFEADDGRPADPAAFAPLFAFKDYELLNEVARGGMGVVYRARQRSLDRTVAIKVILGGHLANETELKRFRAEAETAGRLQHPNIVAIHEVGEHAGQPFFSMDLVEGRNLAQVVKDETLSWRRAAEYVKTIAGAVHYAHQHGVLHRDLKPSNILIDENDEPRVTDFGLAKQIATHVAPEVNDLTITGQVLGSPSFISPEQAAGQRGAVGPASDVYSMGAILYYCLTARPPFVADTLTQTLRMLAEEEPLSPRLLNASVPRDLETICLKCLEKDPKQRYATAQALADELGRFLQQEPIHARPIGWPEKVWRWCKRKPALATASFLVLVVAIGSPLAAYSLNRQRIEAEANEKKAAAEATRSRAAVFFMASILEGAGPAKAQGRDITVLREILDDTADRLKTDLKDQPEVEADLRIVIGKTYAELGLYSNAMAMTEEALRLRRSHVGTNSTAAADAIHNLAAFRYSTGDFAGAERAGREALEMRRRLLGNNHTNVATTLNNLGIALWNQGKLKEAEQCQLEAMSIRARVLGEASLDFGLSVLNLGNIRWAMGDFAGAETNMARALEVLRSQLSEDHPHVAILQNNLATMLARKGELTEAEKLHRRTAEIRRRVLNGEHEDIAYSLTQLALVLTAALSLDEASTHLHEALAMQERLQLGEHGADTLAAFGMLLAKQGSLDAAETNLRKSLDMRRKFLGAENPDTTDTLDALAVVLATRGQLDHAREMWSEALTLGQRGSGAGHINLIPICYHLGWLLRLQGDAAGAEARHTEALAISSKNGTYGVWPFLKSIYDLTDILKAQARFSEAEPLMTEAAAYAKAQLDGNPSLRRDTYLRLVRFYEAWNDFEPNTGKDSIAAAWRDELTVPDQP